MKEKWFIKKKHVVSFNLLAIGCAIFFTGCNKHLDEAIIGEKPLGVSSSSAITNIHVDCLHKRWFEGEEVTKAGNNPLHEIDYTSLFKQLANKIASNYLPEQGGVAVEKLLDIFFPIEKEDPVQKKLDQILGQLDDIKDAITKVGTEVKLSNYDAAFREKETMYINLQTVSIIAWKGLQRVDNTAGLSQEERISQRKLIINEWGNKTINGAGTTPLACINFAKKVMSVAAEQKNYFQIYDEYASKYFGFEKESFAWRENCRDRDLSLFSITVILSELYNNVNNSSQELKNELVETANNITKFSEVYKVNYDTYNSGVNICYIPKMEGMRFKKEILEIPYDWYTDYKNGVVKDIDNYSNPNFKSVCYIANMPSYRDSRFYFLTTVMNFGNNVISSAYSANGRQYKHISRGQIELIYDFYNKKSSNKSSLEEILCSNGFKIVQTDYTGKKILKEEGTSGLHYRVLLSSDGHYYEREHWYNNNYKLYMRGVEMMSKDWFSDDFRIGIAWDSNDKDDAITLAQWDTAPWEDVRFYCLYYSE